MSARGHDRDARRNKAFTEVFDAHWGAVRPHVEGVVSDDAEVAAIVSEVFLKAWARLDAERPMSLVWLLKATHRVMRARAARPDFRHGTLDVVHDAVSRGDEPADLAMRARVVVALSALSVRERRIIMLTYWDGLTTEHVAEVIGSSQIRVRRTRARAEARLLAALDLEGVD
jgi:RNA polymerase sigma factor (sigma-70 family)